MTRVKINAADSPDEAPDEEPRPTLKSEKPASSTSSAPAKETIYLEADDEITAIIDKVESAKAVTVELVLPKRSSALQSIVNLRLLKKSAEAADQKIVLVSEEPALAPLAGAAGLAVAKNLKSAAAVPAPPSPARPEPAEKFDEAAPLGEMAVRHAEDTAEVVKLDDGEKVAAGATAPAATKTRGGLKVPNFDRFRLLLIGGIAAIILLIVGSILALIILPKATINVQTTSLPVAGSLSATADANAKSLDEAKGLIPAVLQTQKKSQTQSANTTGQQNQGDKATGTLTIFYCPNNNNSSLSLPAGSAFSAGGLIFRTTAAVSVPASNFTGGGVCKKDVSQTANVAADQGGSNYNLSGRAYTNPDHSDVSANGSQMSGGSDKNVTVVAQSDVDGAAAKLAAGDGSIQSDFQKSLDKQNLYVFSSTLNVSKAEVTASPAVGQPGSSTTVGREVTFTALTVKKADLNKFIADGLNSQFDTKRQKLSTTDLIGASQISLASQSASTNASFNIVINTTAIPIIDEASLKNQLAGKKEGEVRNIVGGLPGVKGVTVKYSPFFVSKAPGPSKITILQQQVGAAP